MSVAAANLRTFRRLPHHAVTKLSGKARHMPGRTAWYKTIVASAFRLQRQSVYHDTFGIADSPLESATFAPSIMSLGVRAKRRVEQDRGDSCRKHYRSWGEDDCDWSRRHRKGSVRSADRVNRNRKAVIARLIAFYDNRTGMLHHSSVVVSCHSEISELGCRRLHRFLLLHPRCQRHVSLMCAVVCTGRLEHRVFSHHSTRWHVPE